MSPPLQLMVIDLAGTTVRADGIIESSVRSALAATVPGIDLTSAMASLQSLRGGDKRAMFMALLGNAQLARIAHGRFEADLEARIARGEMTPIDGAEETLAELRSAGVRIALTTGFSVRVRETLLSYLGWARLVDLVLSPADAGRGRPWPDLVLTAALRTRVDAVASIGVVGDTVNDLLAGTRAGASLVAGVLTGAHTRGQLAAAPHTHIIDSIAHLSALIP